MNSYGETPFRIHTTKSQNISHTLALKTKGLKIICFVIQVKYGVYGTMYVLCMYRVLMCV